MFPLPISFYVYIALGALAIGGIGYGRYEHNNYVEFKKDVSIQAEKQKAETESIKKQQEITTKGIQDEYDAKLSLVRQYYANGVRQPNGRSTMSGISTTSSLADAISSYNQLAASCAETTLQLTELQKWINQQVGINAE